MDGRLRQHEPDASPKHDGPLIAFHLLGTIDFDACLALQTRLVYEAGGRDDGRIVVLLAEHPPLITLGRAGSRGHVRLSELQMRRERLETRWVSRGGGCVLHQPGQLAIYPIVPLTQRGWSVGEYLAKFKQALLETLLALHVQATALEHCPGIHGRSGVLATLGIAVRNWITFHGAWLNVSPLPRYFQQIDAFAPELAPSGHKSTMSALLSERRSPVTMTQVRSVLMQQLTSVFECPRQHVHSGHPLHRPALAS